MALTSGSRVGPYEILSPLGSGGMGEVWKARDTRLDRFVAIKQVAPRSLERFETEARAIAALNHPHICQIYDVGPDYLVLEYVAGAPPHGPMSPDQAVRLALQVAGALEAAHARGILHRDLKPANILVTPTGDAKLLDFGLAKTISSDDVTRTIEGTVIGTVAYMAPEQAQGQPVDARTDIFSFGAVLYELLSGRRAFEGASTADVLSAILRDEPRPLDTTPTLARIVARCFAKRPGDRFATMAEVRSALTEAANSTHPEGPSIAVLPFANMSADPDHEYFSDGLAEEIINALAQVQGLKVTARTSAFAFRGKEQDLRKVAEVLGVRTILEGSVRRAGSRIRVTAQLIKAEDGNHLWSQRYDRELTDIFAVQDDIATAIAGALKVTLSSTAAGLRHDTPGVAAYEADLKGRHQLELVTADSFARGLDFFEQAIALNPAYVAAHVGLASCYRSLATEGVRPAREVMPIVRNEAARALALNPSDTDALAILGSVALGYDYDAQEVERVWRALGERPDSNAAVYFGIQYLASRYRNRDVVDLLERALQYDPLNTLFRSILGFMLEWAGDYDRALAYAERLEREGGDVAFGANFVLGSVYAAKGMFAEALSAAETAYKAASWHPRFVGHYAGLLMRAGNRSRAEEVLRDLRDSPNRHGVPMGMIQFHIDSRELDGVMDWFDKAVEQREPLAVVYTCCPYLDSLRSSPRWKALLKTMNLPEKSGRI